MTRRVDTPDMTIIIIEDEPDRKCEKCGTVGDCRPYGPNDEMICITCAEKDPIQTEMKIHEHLFGEIITREQAEERLKRSKRNVN